MTARPEPKKNDLDQLCFDNATNLAQDTKGDLHRKLQALSFDDIAAMSSMEVLMFAPKLVVGTRLKTESIESMSIALDEFRQILEAAKEVALEVLEFAATRVKYGFIHFKNNADKWNKVVIIIPYTHNPTNKAFSMLDIFYNQPQRSQRCITIILPVAPDVVGHDKRPMHLAALNNVVEGLPCAIETVVHEFLHLCQHEFKDPDYHNDPLLGVKRSEYRAYVHSLKKSEYSQDWWHKYIEIKREFIPSLFGHCTKYVYALHQSQNTETLSPFHTRIPKRDRLIWDTYFTCKDSVLSFVTKETSKCQNEIDKLIRKKQQQESRRSKKLDTKSFSERTALLASNREMWHCCTIL